MPNAPRPPWASGDAEEWGTPTRIQAGSAADPPRSPPGRRPWPPPQSPPQFIDRPQFADPQRFEEPVRPEPQVRRPGEAAPRRAAERGLPGWAALLVLIVIAGIGAAIDNARGNTTGGGFNIGIIVASLAAILVVRRSGMFPIVIAPPIVYSLGSVFILYLRSGGLSDRHVLYDAASNWLVYGFPAIAAATAAVLIVCGVRLITRR